MSSLSRPVTGIAGTAVDPASDGGVIIDPTSELTQPGGPFPAGYTIQADGAGGYVIAASAAGTPSGIRDGRVATTGPGTLAIGTTGEESVLPDSTNTSVISFAGTLAADITVSGAGGLDTGSEAASTWYAVHVIADSSATNSPAALLSTSATAPTLPGGYDLFRRVGWVRNDASSDFVPFYQAGTGLNRQVFYTDFVANRQVLSGGAAVGFASVDASAVLPPTAVVAYMETRENGSAALFLARVAPTVLMGISAGNEFVAFMPVTAAQAFAYGHLAAGGSTYIWILGYVEEL